MRVSFSLGVALALGAALCASRPAAAQTYALFDLGVLPGASGPRSQANGLNNRGQIVGSSNVAGLTTDGFYYNGTMTDVGKLPGGGSSSLSAINDAGVAVGGGSTSGVSNRALLSVNGAAPVELGGLATGKFNFANAINSSGFVVGSANNAANVRKGFVYNPTTQAFTAGERIVGFDLQGQSTGFLPKRVSAKRP